MQQALYDWQTLIAAIQVWLAGGNPYAEYTHPTGKAMQAGAFAYPPPFLLVGTPFALMPWMLSGLLMLLISIVLWEYWVRCTSKRTGLFWLLLWLPLTQGLWLGQTTLLSLALLAVAYQLTGDKKDRLAGILLALAILKPQTVLLPAAWMLFEAYRGRRWHFLQGFTATSLVLWGGIALITGPQIYIQWLQGLRDYGSELANRPLIFPPIGPVLALGAGFLWWRHGRGDWWAGLLLLNTLLYPLSVSYVAVGLAFVIIRWRPDWPHYPLILSWLIPGIWPVQERTADALMLQVQLMVATGLLAGLLPAPQLRFWKAREIG
jgi:Glycosyltransferase family 87